jgi:hypothetical protein
VNNMNRVPKALLVIAGVGAVLLTILVWYLSTLTVNQTWLVWVLIAVVGIAVIAVLVHLARRTERDDLEEDDTSIPATPASRTPTPTPAVSSSLAWRDIRPWLIAAVVVVILAATAGTIKGRWDEYMSTPRVSTTPSRPLSRALPADVVLPIIAKHESDNRQFEKDGVTPLVNRKEGSTATGKFQIIASLHEERAKSLGHDIRTEEGNEAFAKILFAEEGLAPWKESRSRWEPELRTLGLDPDLGVPTGKFVARIPREWVELRPRTGRRWDWMPRAAVTYELMNFVGKTFIFPAVAQAPVEVGSALPPWIKFRSVDADSVMLDVTFSIPR